MNLEVKGMCIRLVVLMLKNGEWLFMKSILECLKKRPITKEQFYSSEEHFMTEMSYEDYLKSKRKGVLDELM